MGLRISPRKGSLEMVRAMIKKMIRRTAMSNRMYARLFPC